MPKDPTNPYDFLKLFEGQDEKKIRERMRRALEILEAEQENDMLGMSDIMRGTMGTREFNQEERPAAPPFDPSAASQSVTALQQEYSRLMRNPSRNMARMKQIQGEIGQLEGQLQQHNQAVRQNNAQAAAPELGALEADIANLTAEHSQLITQPSKNHARLKQIRSEIEKRTQRHTALLNGAPTSNEWKEQK